MPYASKPAGPASLKRRRRETLDSEHGGCSGSCLAGCAGTALGVFATLAPPPARVEAYVAPPGQGFFWINERWTWRDAAWAWMPGHRERIPLHRHRWEEGRGVRRGSRYYWHEGRWRWRNRPGAGLRRLGEKGQASYGHRLRKPKAINPPPNSRSVPGSGVAVSSIPVLEALRSRTGSHSLLGRS